MPPALRRTLLGLALAVGIALLVGAGLLFAYISETVSPERAGETLSLQLGRPVSVDAVRLRFRPELAVRAEGVLVGGRLRLAAVEGSPRLASLLRGSLEVDTLRIEGLQAAVVRLAEGGVEIHGLEGQEQTEIGPPPLTGDLRIVLQDARVLWVDEVLERETPILLKRVSLTGLAAGGTARLELDAALGEGGALGRATGSVEMGPIDAEAPIDAQAFRASLKVERLAAGWVRPLLPANWDLRSAAGAPSGTLELETSQEPGFRLAWNVDAPEGSLDHRGIVLQGLRSEGHVDTRGGTTTYAADLEARRIALPDQEVTGVRTSLHWKDGLLEIDRLRFESFQGGLLPDDLSGQTRFEVEHSGRIRFQGELSFDDRPLRRLPALTIQDALVRCWDEDDPARAQHFRLVSLEIGAVEPGRATDFRGHLRLGRNGQRGGVQLAGRTAKLSADQPVLDQGGQAQLVFDELDVAWPLELFEPAHLTGEGRLKGTLDLQWQGPKALDGSADLELPGGWADIEGVRLEEDPTARGRLVWDAEDGFAIPEAQVETGHLRYSWFEGRDARAEGGWDGTTVRFDSLGMEVNGGTLQATGDLVPGSPPRFHAHPEVAGIVLARDPTSEEAPRLHGRGVIAGSLTGDADWLAPLEGQVDLELLGGVVPSQRVLEAVSGALAETARIPRRTDREQHATHIERIAGSLDLEGGKAHSEDIVIRTDDYNGEGSLEVDAQGDFQGDGEVRLTTRGLGRTLSTLSLSFGEGEARVPPVPVRITGNLTEIEEIDVDPRLTKASRDSIRRAVGMPAKTARGVLEAGREALSPLIPGEGEAEEPPAAELRP